MTACRRWISVAAAGLGLLLVPASTSAQDQPGPSDLLTLDAAVDLAREASQSLERSRLEIDVARAELSRTRASLFPRVAASVGLAYIRNPSEGVTVPAGAFGVVPDPSTGGFILIPGEEVAVFPGQENLGVSATLEIDQPIFTSGKLRAGVDAAVVAVEASGAQREAGVRELRRHVTLAYAGVSAGRESVVIVEEILRVLEARVADVEAEYEAGAVTRVDVLSEQSRYASARAQLVRARQALASAEANLVWLIGSEPGELEALEGLETFDLPAELPGEAELVERARGEHPMLDELRMTASRAAIGVEAAVAASLLRPDIGLRVQAEVIGQTFPFLEDEWKESWEANLTISVGTSATVFDAGASRARRDVAEARLAQSRSAITEFSESIPLRVRSSLERYFVARAMLAEARAQLAAAEEQARVARVSFENELITRGDVLGARLGVLEAQLAAIGARAEGAGALAEIEYLAGSYRKTD